MAAEFDFCNDFAIVIGDDFSHEFYWEDANCDPLPLTGDFFAQIRKAGALIAEFTCSITGAESNIVLVELPSSITSILDPISGALWDLEHHDPLIKTVIRGKVDIVRGVTEVGAS